MRSLFLQVCLQPVTISCYISVICYSSLHSSQSMVEFSFFLFVIQTTTVKLLFTFNHHSLCSGSWTSVDFSRPVSCFSCCLSDLYLYLSNTIIQIYTIKLLPLISINSDHVGEHMICSSSTPRVVSLGYERSCPVIIQMCNQPVSLNLDLDSSLCLQTFWFLLILNTNKHGLPFNFARD